LEVLLCKHRSAGNSAIITGLGGVGKSALAAELVRHLETRCDALPGGIIFCGEAIALNNLGLVVIDYDQLPHAEQYFIRALAIREEVDDRNGLAATLTNLNMVAYRSRLPESARRHLRRALAIRQEIGDCAGEAMTSLGLGRLAARSGCHVEACPCYQHALAIQHERGDLAGARQTQRHLEALHCPDSHGAAS
jgi:hypothetical protein